MKKFKYKDLDIEQKVKLLKIIEYVLISILVILLMVSMLLFAFH